MNLKLIFGVKYVCVHVGMCVCVCVGVLSHALSCLLYARAFISLVWKCRLRAVYHVILNDSNCIIISPRWTN